MVGNTTDFDAFDASEEDHRTKIIKIFITFTVIINKNSEYDNDFIQIFVIKIKKK